MSLLSHDDTIFVRRPQIFFNHFHAATGQHAEFVAGCRFSLTIS